MLNKNNERELAYVVLIDAVTPIKGYDRVELAHVGGWTIVVGKGEFKAGDPAIYFEIDSKLPEVEPFTNMEFLAKKKYKIKTQKMCKSISQGLLMSAENFGWEKFTKITAEKYGIVEAPFAGIYNSKDNEIYFSEGDSRFLTKKLGVIYATTEDNKRKGKSADKYKKMAQHHGKLFAKQPFRWLMKRNWGKKLLFIFFGKKKDKRGWPAWVQKTDEERVQNMTWILQDKSPWIATEKIDGTSTTFTLKRGHGLFHPEEFYVCSRNVVFDKPDKQCYYETNVYTEMAEKYDIYNKMKYLLDHRFQDCEWITIQGETYGPGIQKRDYHAPEHAFMAFNFINSEDGRWGTEEMTDLLFPMGIPCVPLIDNEYILPDTVEELLDFATGESACDTELREGIVFRSKDGQKSFKAVSNEYLLKYH